MKSLFRYIITLGVLIVLIFVGYDESPLQEYSLKNKYTNLYINSITHQQTKGQVGFFRDALDEFGATSVEDVIAIWAKAEETRNGVFHYAVACKELKSKIINEWGDPKENFWIIYGSSPWLDKYEVVYNRKINESKHEVKIKFFWVMSSGSVENTETILHIIKDKDIWCVKEAI